MQEYIEDIRLNSKLHYCEYYAFLRKILKRKKNIHTYYINTLIQRLKCANNAKHIYT